MNASALKRNGEEKRRGGQYRGRSHIRAEAPALYLPIFAGAFGSVSRAPKHTEQKPARNQQRDVRPERYRQRFTASMYGKTGRQSS